MNTILILVLTFGLFSCNNKSTFDLCKKALIKMDNKEYDKALIIYKEVLDLDPKYCTALSNIAWIYDEYKENELALSYYDKTIEQCPNDYIAYKTRANFYSRTQKYELAIKDYDFAINMNSKDAQNYYERSNAYYFLKKHENAINDLSIAIDLSPKMTKAYTNRANILFEIGKIKESISDFSKAIQLSIDIDEISKLRNHRAGAFYLLKDYKNAESDLTFGIKNSTDQNILKESYYNLASLSSLQGKLEKSCEYLENAVKNGFDNFEYIKNDNDLNNIKKLSCYLSLIK